MACDEARFGASYPARRSQPRRQAVRGGGSDAHRYAAIYAALERHDVEGMLAEMAEDAAFENTSPPPAHFSRRSAPSNGTKGLLGQPTADSSDPRWLA